MVVKREIECQLPVMGPFYEMIANVYAQGWVELLLTRFQWIFFFADALDSLCLVWQYRLWSFQAGGIKLDRFLYKNQHTKSKLLNFEF